jgi:hypothetical protein
MSGADPAAYELAYVEARRALEVQAAAIAELRSRAALLVAAAAVTTSFFGGAVLADGHGGLAAWLAVAAFVGVGGCVLVTVWHRHDWTFAVDARKYVAVYLESDEGGPYELAAIHKELALHMAASFRANRRQLRFVLRALRGAALLLAMEVVSWLAALVAQGQLS